MDAAWTFFIIGVIVIFAVMETFAIKNNKTTLSRFVWKVSRAWPPLPFVIGLIVGGLAVHFWWPWCPT